MHTRSAFTFIEVVVVMGIISLLFALTAPDLFKMQDRNALQNTTTELVSLLRQQQFNAMNSPRISGIHFTQSKYVLFGGQSYTEGAPENVEKALTYPLSFSAILFPDGNVQFASGSGELVGYSPSGSQITLTDTVHLVERTIHINQLGVPTVDR